MLNNELVSIPKQKLIEIVEGLKDVKKKLEMISQ